MLQALPGRDSAAERRLRVDCFKLPMRSRVWLRLKCSAAPSLWSSAAGHVSNGLPVPLRRNRSAVGLRQNASVVRVSSVGRR